MIPDHDRAHRLLARKAELLGFLTRRVGNRADAEDLLQTAFVRLLEARQTLRDEARLVPWFYRVLANLVADAHRRRSADVRRAARAAAEPHAAQAWDDDLLRQVCVCVMEVLGTLPHRYRKILTLAYLEERRRASIARVLGITPNNMHVRLHRARAALLEGLAQVCGACLEHGCLDCSCRAERRERLRPKPPRKERPATASSREWARSTAGGSPQEARR